MKQRTKVILGVSLCGALIAGNLLATRSDAPGEALPTPPTAAGDTANTPHAAPVEATPKVWSSAASPGVRLAGRYRLEYSHAMRMLEGAEYTRLPAESRMSVTAELELTPAPVAGEGWVAGRLHEVVVSGDEALLARAELPREAPAESLEAPFMVRFDATGAATERRYSEAMPVGARNVLGSLLTGLQLVVPAGTKIVDGRWEASEEGLDGPLTARYATKAGGFTKAWTRVVGADGWTLDNPGKLTSKGSAEWLLAADDRLAKATLEVDLVADMSLAQAMPLKFSSETKATLARVGEVPAEWAGTLRPEALAARDGAAETEQRAAIEETLPVPSGRTAEAIIAASGAAHRAGDSQARRAAMLDLAATIRTDPKALSYVESQLRTDVGGDGLRTMVEALSYAGTEESLGAMNTLLADAAVPVDSRHSLATAAGLMGEPTPELLETLTALSRRPLDTGDGDATVAKAALLGLAIQGNTTHEDEHTAAIRQDVLTRAEAVLGNDAPAPTGPNEPGTPPGMDADPGLLQAWLQAVGNLGGPEAWPLIKPYLDHPNEWVRFTAVGGLIYVPGQEVRLAVAEVIETDPSHWVRRRAVQTAGNLPQSAFEALVIRTMRTDEAANVRLECARVLAVWGLENPGLYPIIADAAEREPDKTTKKIMGQLQPELIGEPGVDDRTYTPPGDSNDLMGGTP